MTTSNEPRLARLKVDLAAIVENWRIVAGVQPQAETAAVVKADAYGLGAQAAAQALAKAGARRFFVATAGEGVQIRAVLGPGPSIYVLNGISGADRTAHAGVGLTPVLNSLEAITAHQAAGGGSFALHVDTGMNRLGLSPGELDAAREALSGARPALLMSHLACASSPDHPMNLAQRAAFVEACGMFADCPASLSASAGLLLRDGFGLDLTRPGIALYGSWAAENADAPALRTVARAGAPILQIRAIAPGDAVGYGATFTARQPMRLATVGAGYADGVLRSLSGKGFAAVDGVVCAYVGRVSMDLTVIDVTWAKSAAVGAWVELLGDTVTLDALAAAAGAAPYEILTGFGASMARTAA